MEGKSGKKITTTKTKTSGNIVTSKRTRENKVIVRPYHPTNPTKRVRKSK